MLNRRDFLKLAALLPLAGASLHRFRPNQTAPAGAPNILILLFDTWTAENLSLYGYGRRTTPHLERLAERAIVYHQHYAPGNYTTPATASLLTGVYPWHHRALRLYDQVLPQWVGQNLFAAFPEYHRLAYAQNPIANIFLTQFRGELEDYLPPVRGVAWPDLFARLFSQDHIVSSGARRLLLRGDQAPNGSLFLSRLHQALWRARVNDLRAATSQEFPLGPPNLDDENYFTIEDSLDFLLRETASQPGPYLGYFHFFPPHAPYRPRREFAAQFRADGFEIPVKPLHPLRNQDSAVRIRAERDWYDHYLLDLDAQIGRVVDTLERRGDLNNTILVLTADHGEMFERGLLQHFHRSLHQPVVHIPLLIFMPGQRQRVDILSPTSAVDVLPTLAHLTGKPAPDWAEGEILRPFRSGLPNAERPLYGLEAKESHPARRLGRASYLAIRWPYKLTYYANYPQLDEFGGEYIELYNIETDPHELHDLTESEPGIVAELRTLLRQQLDAAEPPEQP